MELITAFINEESTWLIKVLIVLAFFFLLHVGFKSLFNRLQKGLEHSANHWKYSFIQAIRIPLTVLIWLAALIIAVNIIFFHTNPECPKNLFTPIYSLAILLCASWFLLRWTGQMQHLILSERSIHGHHVDKVKVDAISKLVYLLIWSVSIILTLDILGFNIATLVTIGGISGLSLGFAGKDVISNFFGGLMLYITRPFVVGDYIKGAERNIEGTVEHIGWYYTLIRGNDKQPSYVPNAIFSTIVVVNPTRRTHWTFDEKIGIRYRDIQAINPIVEEIKTFFIDSPLFDNSQPIRVYLEHFAESSLDIAILACTFATGADEVALIRQQCLVKIFEIIESHHASFAYPTTTIEIPEGLTIRRPSSSP